MNYTNINIDKNMYTTNKGFNATLEELDPSENYKGTELENLDAFGRQLKRFDIKVGGANSDNIEKFFATTSSAALFPEYISRSIVRGIEEADHLKDIIATTTNINGLDYRSITYSPDTEDIELREVDEGDEIPTTEITPTDSLITLKKHGRMLSASYEALRFQRLDVFSVMLRQIGAQIARSEFNAAVDAILNGSGDVSAAEVLYTETDGVLEYSDLVNFWNAFSPYELNTIIASPDMMAKLLNMTEFKDANAGQDFHGSGKLITPMGVKLIKSSAVPEGKIIGLDKNCAIEKVQAGSVLTEFDKLIDRQLERAAITSISGFSRLFPDAAKVLSLAQESEEESPPDDGGDESIE